MQLLPLLDICFYFKSRNMAPGIQTHGMPIWKLIQEVADDVVLIMASADPSSGINTARVFRIIALSYVFSNEPILPRVPFTANGVPVDASWAVHAWCC